jgi:hypothetical protein
MVKAFLKIFLSLSVFFLAGHGSLHVHASSGECSSDSPEKNLKASVLQPTEFLYTTYHFFFTSASSDVDKHFDPMLFEREERRENEEEDDDEYSSLRKHFENALLGTSIFFTHISTYMFTDSRAYLLSEDAVPYLLSSRYLALQVLRI